MSIHVISSGIEENASLLINIFIDKERKILFDLLLRNSLREPDFYITIG